MRTTSPTARSHMSTFPAEAVREQLHRALMQLESDTSAIRDEWDLAFDSLAVVSILCCIDEVVPGLNIAPDEIVRKGGYVSIDEALQHLADGVQRAWQKSNR